MTKLFMILFSALTIGAGYLTYHDKNYDTSESSIRSGSSGSSNYRSGGYSYGK